MKTKLLSLILTTVLFVSCSNKNNEITYLKFENEFNKNILDNKAKSFNFEYDGLVPQNSYFVNSKLKFLKYKHGSENGSIESLITPLSDLRATNTFRHIVTENLFNKFFREQGVKYE